MRPFRNRLFIWLRNLWYSNYIYVSILNYVAGRPRPHDPLRIEYATEICRVFVVQGHGNFPGFDLMCVIFAAVAFAESRAYERESRWIYEKIMGEGGPGRNWPVTTRLYRRMGELWGNQHFEWVQVPPEFGVGE